MVAWPLFSPPFLSELRHFRETPGTQEEKARSVGTINDIVELLNLATNFAALKVSELNGVTVEEKFHGPADLSNIDMIEKYNLSVCKDRVNRHLNKKYGKSVYVATISGRQIPLKTSMAIYGNGGMTTLPAASRASRFFSYVFEEIQLTFECSELNHNNVKVGEKYVSSKATGRVVGLSYRKNSKGLEYPATSICKCVGMKRCAWIRVKKHNKYTIVRVYLLK